MSKEELTPILEEIAAARGVDKQAIVDAIESGVSIAARVKTGKQNLEAVFNIETGSFTIAKLKRVVELVNEPEEEISFEEAEKIEPVIQKGDEIAIEFPFPELGRLAAMVVRRIMKKSMEEIEADYRKDLMELAKWKMVAVKALGIHENGDILCASGEKHAILPRKEQLFREDIKIDDIVQAVVIDVTRQGKEPVYVISRTHPLLLGGLFMREVPEISDGYIVIKGLVRDTAGRSKVSVFSKSENIDAVGACVGPGGKRVERITAELTGENIDIIVWSEKDEEYIASALTPAKVKSVSLNKEKQEAWVVVEDNQHPLAVGKGGLNIRLASRLTRWNIQIK